MTARLGPAAGQDAHDDDAAERLARQATALRAAHRRTDRPEHAPPGGALLDQTRLRLRVEELDRAAPDDLARAAVALFAGHADDNRLRRLGNGVRDTAEWLLAYPGDTWQDRWTLAGADDAWTEREQATSEWGWKAKSTRRRGVEGLLHLRVIAPSWEWLLVPHRAPLVRRLLAVTDPDWDARLRETALGLGATPQGLERIMRDLTRLCLRTGKTVSALAVEDFVTAQDHANATQRDASTRRASFEAPFVVAREAGILPEQPVNLRAARSRGQLTPAELVDQHGVQSPVARHLLVSYLAPRQADLVDYTTLQSISDNVVRLWWREIERLSPTGPPSTMSLPPELADEWKTWLRDTPTATGAARLSVDKVFADIRVFYRWLNDSAEAEPEKYAAYAARPFILRKDTAGARKRKAATKARLDQDTRRLTAAQRRFRAFLSRRVVDARERLDLAAATPPGQAFACAGEDWVRVAPGDAGTVRAARAGDPQVRDLEDEEDEAFWSWAIVEAFCVVGVRIEELLELTVFDFLPYTLPDGRVVPLLHTNPSKNDRERLIPLMREEAAVFSAIKKRITRPDGTVPAVTRYDRHERVYSPELPHLFQRRTGIRGSVPSDKALRDLIARAVTAAGLDREGVVKIRPHDFRRLFVTSRLEDGVPIQVVSALVGHNDYGTTAGYAAVYPKTVISAYLKYASKKREHRPAEENAYDPAAAAAARAEFEQRFGSRQVRTGTCMRPYDEDCKRQHNCVRCPLVDLRRDAATGLARQQKDSEARLAEAGANGWTAEADGARADLQAIREKTERLDRRRVVARIPGAEDLSPGSP